MNPSSFYSKKTVDASARPILNPELSEDSDLSSESDESIYFSDCEYDLPESEESPHDFSESDDEQPVNQPAQPQKRPSKKTRQQPLKWKRANNIDVTLKGIPFTGNPPLQVLPLQEPIDYFRDIINDELIARIVEASNTYAAQVDIDKPLNLTSDELEQFIGILFLMSVVKMPNTRAYWERFLQYDRIASIMSVRRFERIKRFLHCNDNEKMNKDFPKKLFKIRPLIDALKERFDLLVPTELLCIDEQMVPFKGRSTLKQYNPQKQKKWGYKLYVLTNPDGIIYTFMVHTGTINVCSGQPDLQASGNIVMQLLTNIPRHKDQKLFIDNWYTVVPLVTTLMNQGIALVGTVCASRLRDCTMPLDKDMKKEGRGTVAIQTCKSDGVELRAIK